MMPMRASLLLPLLATFGSACGGPRIDVGVPFQVAFVAPDHGATGVAVDVEPSIGFNQPVDEGSLEASLAIRIQGEEVARNLILPAGGHVATVLLAQELPSAATVEIAVGPGVESADGVALGAEMVVSFVTAVE